MSNRLKSGRYELVRKLGEGSQGETWDAVDHAGTLAKDASRPLAERFQAFVDGGGARPSAPRPNVAIKRFRVARATSWKDVELAEREAKTLASLSHPLLPVYVEHFEEDGALYLVMEKIEGQSVASIARSSPEEVLRMLRDLGDALAYLHGLAPPVIHRDIKPSNVIRRHDGSFVLVDFGAVRDRLKPEGGSTVVGTFGYMAPEQFQGRASPKSDVYGAAATALRLLTGSEPEALPHVGLAIDVAAAVPPGTPKALIRALELMTRPDPDRRAASIAEALSARGREEEARRPSRDARPSREESRRERRERRDARRRKRRARARRAPFVLRAGAFVGLLVARLAVWMTFGVIVPFVLSVLSVIFGERLRRAARASIDASSRTNERLRVRVDDAPPVRIATEDAEEDEQTEAREADEEIRDSSSA